VSANLVLNRTLPVIGEWCPVCKAFREHANGSIQVPRPMEQVERLNVTSTQSLPVIWRCATRCLYCSWITIYH